MKPKDEILNVTGWRAAAGGADAYPEEILTPEMVASMSAEEVDERLRRAGLDPRAPVPPKSFYLAVPYQAACSADATAEMAELAEAIACRHAERTGEIIARWDNIDDRLWPTQKNAACLLNLCAQYIDVDSSYLPLVERAIRRFEQVAGGSLTKLDSAYLDTAKGFVDLHYERYCHAIAHFRHAMKVADSIRDADLKVMARYNLARSYWKKGYYYTALRFACKAKGIHRTLRGASGRPKEIAAIEMLESWLLFLLGKFNAAQRVLGHAESILAKEGDYIDRGNLLSVHGRFAKHEKRYPEALGYFKAAITQYERHDRKYPNIARTHTNIASVYRYMANDLEKSLIPVKDRPKLPEQIRKLRQLAFKHLELAERIYLENDRRRHHRGLGKVYIYCALIYFDMGDLDEAESSVSEACLLGEAKNDDLLICKVRRIQCSIAENISAALELAREAVISANNTDSRREQAKAYICLGRLLKPNDMKAAQWCEAEAIRLLSPAEFAQEASRLLPPAALAQSDWRVPADMLQGSSELLC